MTATVGWKSRIYKLIAAAMLLGAQPVSASDTRSLDNDAVSEYNAGLDAEDAGQNQNACIHYRNAAGLWNNAIFSLLGNGMTTEEGREGAKQIANQLQVGVDKAKKKAAAVCGLSNGPARSSSSSSSSSVNVDLYYEKKLELQKTTALAQSQYQDATTKYDANDMAGACASGRLAADNYTKVANAIKADRALEAAFGNPNQIYADAKLVAEVRDDMFCVDPVQKAEVQRTAVLASNQYDEAMRLWDAGDRPGACSAMRMSAANFAKVLSAMTTSPALKNAFNEPEVIAENAAMSARVRDTMFCKG